MNREGEFRRSGMVAGAARISRSAMIFELNFVYGHAVPCMKIELGVDRNELVCSGELV